ERLAIHLIILSQANLDSRLFGYRKRRFEDEDRLARQPCLIIRLINRPAARRALEQAAHVAIIGERFADCGALPGVRISRRINFDLDAVQRKDAVRVAAWPAARQAGIGERLEPDSGDACEVELAGDRVSFATWIAARRQQRMI